MNQVDPVSADTRRESVTGEAADAADVSRRIRSLRGVGEHRPPSSTQDRPEDNTSPWVTVQVNRWRATAALIHPEIAREIAAWWQSPRHRDPFQLMAGAGIITAAMLDAIAAARRLAVQRRCGEPADVDKLDALAAYVTACPDTICIIRMQELVDLAEAAAAGDSNDEEIEALTLALSAALARWPGIYMD